MTILERYDYSTGTNIPRPGFEDWQEVFHEETGGYEWRGMAGWYSPSQNRYFWLSDSGCSCNGFGDNVSSVDEFENGSRADLLRNAEEHITAGSHYGDNYSPEQRIRALAAIRDFKETVVVFEATRVKKIEAPAC